MTSAPASPVPQAAPPLSSQVTVLGARTHLWEYGDPSGPPLLLVHGFRGDHHGLELIAQRLPGFRVIVPDLPGFGISEAFPAHQHDLAGYAAWLNALVAELGLGRFFVLGHSFGSLVVSAAISSGLSPERTVLINPIAAPALAGPKRLMTKLAVLYYRAGAALPGALGSALLANPLIVRVMSETMAKTREPELRAWIHDQHDRYFSLFSDRRTVSDAFDASISATVRQFAPALTAPTLIIAADRDDITPLAATLALRRELADAELRIVPGVGHLIHYEAPDDAAAWITDFLA
ncbi:alpha/beta fold hydrolase [Leucobacter sp. M11]|uniref:alpha/beta fold hydrolase n=1 Tax=Leucobacter sp. M11 TaxID=2993565 RepID=UPI002D801584|nr:alpha/beta hydrolase [Leucobacter sp. M11]MEB4616341.1 alpha/beta hydrolase [Leucobacter sp. M11]